MNKTEYAYAVGRIRANETRLLTQQDYEQLITSADDQSAIRILCDKGWPLSESSPIGDTEKELDFAWKLISESVPDPALLEALIIGNDFFNLKAALKTVFSDLEPDNYYTKPCITDTGIITKAVKTHDFSILPEYLSECADKAYEALTNLNSGQYAEFIIDKASLEYRLSSAASSGSEALKKIIDLKIASANIKIALRCSANGKSAEFAEQAMIPFSGFDIKALIESSGSFKEIANYVSSTEYSFLCESISKGFNALEETCDNEIFKLVSNSKYDVFGPEPIIAYWFCKCFEVRNARVILSAKANNLSADEIRKRVRGVYV